MSDRRDEELEHLLRSRRIEPARSDLAQRIVLAARQRPQSANAPFWGWVQDLFREFHLPQPGYVLAGALLLGMVIGFNAPEESGFAGEEAVGIQSFLSADEALL
jgi:hypothetical protein